MEPNEVAYLSEVLDDGHGLSKGQMKYYNFIENRDRAIVFTLIGTGLRLAELCSVSLEDINFTNLSIMVTGKGDITSGITSCDKEKCLREFRKHNFRDEWEVAFSNNPYSPRTYRIKAI